MNLFQRMSLARGRFAPVEERLLAAAREALPEAARAAFDAQVAAIDLVQRDPGWSGIRFYRRRGGRVDWTGVPLFPRTGEFELAEVRFTASGRRYRAVLAALDGHLFDFGITPGAERDAFAEWEGEPRVRLLGDPTQSLSGKLEEQLPPSWQEVLAASPTLPGWVLHDRQSAYRVHLEHGHFLVLAERGGTEFILHQLEPPAAALFYLSGPDSVPAPLTGSALDRMRRSPRD